MRKTPPKTPPKNTPEKDPVKRFINTSGKLPESIVGFLLTQSYTLSAKKCLKICVYAKKVVPL